MTFHFLFFFGGFSEPLQALFLSWRIPSNFKIECLKLAKQTSENFGAEISDHSVCSTGVRCKEAFFFFFGAAGSIRAYVARPNLEAVNKMVNPYQECWDGHDENCPKPLGAHYGCIWFSQCNDLITAGTQPLLPHNVIEDEDEDEDEYEDGCCISLFLHLKFGLSWHVDHTFLDSVFSC